MEPMNPAGEEADEIASVDGIEPGWAVMGDGRGRRSSVPILRIQVTRHPVRGGESYSDTLVLHIDDAASHALAAAMVSLQHLPAPPSDQ